MNSPGKSFGMLSGSVVVLVAPLGSKFNNCSFDCDPVPATVNAGVVFSYDEWPSLPADEK